MDLNLNPNPTQDLPNRMEQYAKKLQNEEGDWVVIQTRGMLLGGRLSQADADALTAHMTGSERLKKSIELYHPIRVIETHVPIQTGPVNIITNTSVVYRPLVAARPDAPYLALLDDVVGAYDAHADVLIQVATREAFHEEVQAQIKEELDRDAARARVQSPIVGPGGMPVGPVPDAFLEMMRRGGR